MAEESKQSNGSRRLRGTPSILPRFRRAQGGSTAVEFALLGLPFLALTCGTLEVGLVYWEQEILQQAVVEASRQIYTGKFQTANSGVTNSATLLANFRTAICTVPSGAARLTIFKCANVRVSVTSAGNFSGATPVSPVTVANGVSDWNPNFPSYTCGGSSSIMIVQAAVDVPVFFPALGLVTANLPNKRRVLQAASVFKVEPYTTTSVCS